MMVDGKIYGFPDDGDVFVFYYRKDIFDGRTASRQDGYDSPPRPGRSSHEIGTVPDREVCAQTCTAPAFFRQPPYTLFMFQERFRDEGGKFFDAETMKATVNSDIGVKVFTEMREENKFMPPGVESWGFVENLAAFLAGHTAMTISWPPYGRWAAGYGTDEEALAWVPKSHDRRQGRLCAAAGRPSAARGRLLRCRSRPLRKNKEAAYLFIQWLNSEEISASSACSCPMRCAIRSATRHFTSEEYQVALAGCEGLSRGLEAGCGDRPARSLAAADRQVRGGPAPGHLQLWAGEDPKAILDDAAAQWDAITEKIGVDKQKAVYAAWAGKSGAYPN